MSFFRGANNTIIHDGKFINAHSYQDIHVYSEVSKDAAQILKDWTVPGAFHNSGERFDPPKCHPDTRVAVIERLKQWADHEHKEKPIFWLHGPAGAGKSAIAQTLAEKWHAEKRLAASFFFSRTGPKRGEKTHLVATIVYQLLNAFTPIRPAIQQVLLNDPLIFKKSIQAQVTQLIVNPLRQLFPPDATPIPSAKVVIIDGLDECHDTGSQEEILAGWSQVLEARDIPLILLLASRPEPHICEAFGHERVKSITVYLALNDQWDPSRDITLFLQCKFAELKDKRPWLKNTAWPSEDVIQTLVRKSSGQFIYASTVIKYISVPKGDPRRRLDVVLGLERNAQESPFAELDTLYYHILSQVAHSSVDIVMNVFACLAAPGDEFSDRYGPWLYPNEGYFAGRHARTPTSLEKYLLLDPGEIYMHLIDLHALLYIPPVERADKDPITLYHASFADFLSSEERAGWFYLGIMETNARMVECIWKHTLLALSVTSPLQRILPDQPTETISAREIMFTKYLDTATPTVDMMYSIELALGSRGSYLEASISAAVISRQRSFNTYRNADALSGKPAGKVSYLGAKWLGGGVISTGQQADAEEMVNITHVPDIVMWIEVQESRQQLLSVRCNFQGSHRRSTATGYPRICNVRVFLSMQETCPSQIRTCRGEYLAPGVLSGFKPVEGDDFFLQLCFGFGGTLPHLVGYQPC